MVKKPLSARELEKRKIGKEAADEVRSEFAKLCEERKAGAGYVVDNLIRLSKFRACKAFNGGALGIIYSKPLEFPEVQLGAIKIIGEWQGLKPPDKQEINLSDSVMAAVAAIMSDNDPKRKSK